MRDMVNDAAEMLEAAGAKISRPATIRVVQALVSTRWAQPGWARPKTSVLNKFNQVHACKNVFVTDGSFMTSSACVNPSLTYMAFTARAADYAVQELKKKSQPVNKLVG